MEERLLLIEPTLDREQSIITYRDEFTDREDGIAGTSWLCSSETIEQWIENLKVMQSWETIPEGRMPGYQYLFIRAEDGKVIGMLNLRLALNDYLFHYGGHIGYSIAPSEQRKGYATKMLKLGLAKAKEFGIEKVLVTCNDQNLGSIGTIEKNGGVLENKVMEENSDTIIRRYWIVLD